MNETTTTLQPMPRWRRAVAGFFSFTGAIVATSLIGVDIYALLIFDWLDLLLFNLIGAGVLAITWAIAYLFDPGSIDALRPTWRRRKKAPA